MLDLHAVDTLCMAGIFAILGLGLNIVLGYAGIASVGQAAFLGIGAYSTALACAKYHLPGIAAVPIGMLFSAGLAALLSVPTLRLRDDFLLVATLGFGEVFQLTCRNADWITNGPRGIGKIPSLDLFTQGPGNLGSITFVTWLVVGIVATALYFIDTSPFGRNLKAVRDNETAARSVGHRPLFYKLSAMIMGAVVSSCAGNLLAHKMTFISSETGFGSATSVFILAIVVLGGRASILGPIVAAVLLTFLPECLRRLGLNYEWAAPLRQVTYGCLLVAVAIFRPAGLLGRAT